MGRFLSINIYITEEKSITEDEALKRKYHYPGIPAGTIGAKYRSEHEIS